MPSSSKSFSVAGPIDTKSPKRRSSVAIASPPEAIVGF
jgi:hypothetical protein